jgi:hypothetical protein
MKRIDEKIDSYLTEGSIPLKLMNYSSDMRKFMVILNELREDILSINKTKDLPYDEGDKLIDAIEDAHMSVFFIKKRCDEIAKAMGPRGKKEKNWLIDYMEKK